ncbi:methyltransferase domain-containing protein [Pendulispora brunnea]|uniref:Methyltransferase domain-containing protein n=1 Tax=Pendulispora brunnea TaxID=2905690 RepID=A0ABZ2KAH1_9BACT
MSDVGARMRTGHPHIAEGDAYILERVREFARNRRAPRVLNVGCGGGYLAWRLAEEFPEAQIIAQEDYEPAFDELRKRLGNTRVRMVTVPLEQWAEPVDMVIGWGAHHHMVPSYVDRVRDTLTEGGVFLLGDEFCPDYCNEADRRRIEDAEIIAIVDGFVLTNANEIAEHARSGRVPDAAREMESRRQQALWRWYRYVVDYAMERNHIDIASYELNAAHNDLLTGSSEEHKVAARIVERDLVLRGFRQRSRHALGPVDEPEHRSFVLYELVCDTPRR